MQIPPPPFQQQDCISPWKTDILPTFPPPNNSRCFRHPHQGSPQASVCCCGHTTRAPSQAAPKAPLPLVRHSLVVLPDIWMMHLDSRLISRELKGRTRTATFTDAPAMAPAAPGYC